MTSKPVTCLSTCLEMIPSLSQGAQAGTLSGSSTLREACTSAPSPKVGLFMEVGEKTSGEQVGVSDPQGPPWQESPDVAGAVARGSLRGSSPATSCLLPSTAIQASYSFSRRKAQD